jgi:hypothetical protein
MLTRIVLVLMTAPGTATALAQYQPAQSQPTQAQPIQAQSVCPWFTLGSAAWFLGGDVTVTARSGGNWEGSCRFVRTTRAMSATIEILIGKVNTHTCPEASTKVPALGNEAVQCRRANDHADIIAGRARDAYFVVSLTNVPAAADSEKAPNAHPGDRFNASLVEQVAEQVVGNLY